MKAIKSLASLILCISLADRADAQAIQCEVSSGSKDASCDGTLAAPCSAYITDDNSGGLTGTYKLTYTQLNSDVSSDESMCKQNGGVGDCEDYSRTIFVMADGTTPTNGGVELSFNGIFNICAEACLEAGGTVFTGVCQEGLIPITGGCTDPVTTADDVLCTTALKGGSTYFKSIDEIGTCELGSSFGDGGKACTYEDPCEVKIYGYAGAAEDILEITYNQPKSNDAAMGALCTDARADDSCEKYNHSIFAKVVSGAPTSSEVELSPTVLEALCVAQCLDGAVFTGVCQAAAGDCVVAATNEEVCGVPLVGTVTYEAATAPEPEDTTAQETTAEDPEDPSDEPTTPTDPEATSTTTEGPTSSAAGLMAAASLTTLLLA